MRPLLLALDLDGTLLTEDSALPAGHERAVETIAALGVQVVLATGRALLTTRWVWRRLRLSTPLVCFNGGWVGLPGQEPFAQAVLTETDVHELMAELRGLDGALCCYPSADTWLMDREIAITAHWRDLYQAPIAIRSDLWTAWRGPSLKLMFVADPALVATVVRRLQARFGNRFHVVASQADRLEILPGGVTKAWGLEHLATRLGVPRAQVWAVGDADNDREMIAWAGRGFAMGHAPHSLLRGARERLPGIHARGLCALVPLVERACAHGDG